MSAAPPCLQVKFRCWGGRPALSYAAGDWRPHWLGLTVTQGAEVRIAGHRCVVSHCSPSPCTVTATTAIKWDRMVEYEVERLERNYLVRLRYDDGGTEVYVYPRRVWERVYRDVIEPLTKGSKPRQQGAVLIGPPGTGKTSMAKVIADIVGMEVVEFRPERVMSKWLGESERRAFQLIAEAERLEPSMLLMDDAEWAVRSRATLDYSSSARAYMGMMSILLNRIERWHREGRKVVAVVTSNVSEEEVDPALLRGGRLGRPIYVPLPDVEAVKAVMVEMGVDERRASEWAVKVVTAGLSMADAVGIARELLAGREPLIEPVTGIGFRRYVAPDVTPRVSALLRALDRVYSFSALRRTLDAPGRRIALHFALPEPVAIPLAVAVVTHLIGVPPVVAVDPRFIDEAVSTAKATEGFLVIPSETMPDEYQLRAYMRYDRVVFAGVRRAPYTYAAIVAPWRTADVRPGPGEVRLGGHGVRRGLAELVFRVYGIEHTEEDVKRVCSEEDERMLRLLATAAVYGGPAEKAWFVTP